MNQRVEGLIAWVVGHVPSRGHSRDNHTLMFLSLSPSFSLSIKIRSSCEGLNVVQTDSSYIASIVVD